MDTWHKGLGALLILALIYIVFLQQCRKCPDMETVKIDTTKYITIYDTLWHDSTAFKYVYKSVPKPYYDTVRITIEDFDNMDADFVLKYPAIYQDIITDDTISIEYTAVVRGYLDKITIGYKFLQPFLIEKTTLIETEVTKVKKKRLTGLYIGLDAGGNKESFGYFKPEVTLSLRKTHYSIGYNIPDKSITAGIKIKIL